MRKNQPISNDMGICAGLAVMLIGTGSGIWFGGIGIGLFAAGATIAALWLVLATSLD